MAENLNVTKFRNGDAIHQIKTEQDWEKASKNNIPAWCYYEFNPVHGKVYGKLYNWYAVKDSRGLSPVGWCIPGYNEVVDLTEVSGGKEIGGRHLKSKEIWPDAGKNTNKTGFGGLPGGMSGSGIFRQINEAGYFWTCDDLLFDDSPNSVYFCLSEFDNIFVATYFQGCYFSVRCIKEEDVL